jgi:uncharacterized protein (TIGR00369 family)
LIAQTYLASPDVHEIAAPVEYATGQEWTDAREFPDQESGGRAARGGPSRETNDGNSSCNSRIARKPVSSRTVSKTYGTLNADKQREMSGLEFVRGLVDGTLPLNTMAETLGYDVTEAASGRVVVTAKPNNTHLNPFGTVHGGLAATLLDSCMGLAVLSTLEKGVSQTTLEFKISLVRAVTPETGLIKAEGIVLSCGRRIGTAEGRLTDCQGRLLAHGTTTCLIFQS